MTDNICPVADHDPMLSRDLLEELSGHALAALIDLFVLHGRRTFRPDLAEMQGQGWGRRGGRQKFALAIAELHVTRHIRWLPGGRYRITTKHLLTAAEYRRLYPDAEWRNGASCPTG